MNINNIPWIDSLLFTNELDKQYHERLNDRYGHVELNDQHVVHPNGVHEHLSDVDALPNVQNVDDDVPNDDLHDDHSDDDVDNGRLHS